MKKSVNKNKQKQTKLSTKARVTLVIVCTLIAIPLGFYLYNKILDFADYQKFQGLKTTVTDLNKRLNAVDPTIVWTISEGCGRTNEKYTIGDADCSVSSHAAFGVVDATRLKALADKYYAILKNTEGLEEMGTTRSLYPDITTFIANGPNGVPLEKYGSNTYKVRSWGQLCALNFTLDFADATQTQATLSSHFTCADNARDTWFPRTDI